jgi:hypothetical protein
MRKSTVKTVVLIIVTTMMWFSAFALAFFKYYDAEASYTKATPQCPDGGVKYEADSPEFKEYVNGTTIVFPSQQTFCIKAGTFISGIIIGTRYEAKQDISYFVIYQPTAVDLLYFTVIKQKNKTLVVWETANEMDIIGFNLYKVKIRNGKLIKLNDEIIPALAVGQVTGERYTFVDKKRNKNIKYVLEAVDFNGKGELITP